MSLEAYRLVCGIDADKIYLGQVRAYLSPLDGTYPTPANGIAISPPDGELAANHVWQLNVAEDGWVSIPDYRRTRLYDTVTGQPLPPSKLGEPLPETATLLTPPMVGAKEARRWDSAMGRWELLPDLRGEGYWLADGQYHVICEIGETPPVGALTEPPPPTTEQLEFAARSQRDVLLSSSEWLIQRHRDEQEAGRQTSLSTEQYAELQTWRQALRDWPTSQGWPTVAVPQAPAWLNN